MEAESRERYDPARHGERRAPEPLLYTREQLLGRAPIRLRRASDKRRLAAHLVLAAVLMTVTAWWVLVPRLFVGPVMFVLIEGHGLHLGDLPSLLLVAVAVRSLLIARRLSLAPPGATAPSP